MPRILPIRYRPDWSKIPVQKYIRGMVPVVYTKIADHMKLQITEEQRNTETSWDGTYKMVKIPPGYIPDAEVQRAIKTLGYGKVKWCNFMWLPKGYELFTHQDRSRKCAINFVQSMANPFVFDGKAYNYDRFFFDCGVPHSVPVGEDRISMQLAFHDHDFEEILEHLKADGWV